MRIMVIGRSGSGKSTFSVKLGKALGLPVVHLDKYFFESNWQERDYQSFINMQIEFVIKARWIIDGNATRSFDLRYSNATHCIYFNFPRYICYWRVFKRLFNKDSAIDDRADNCKEKVSWSLLKYMWGFEKRVKAKLSWLQSSSPEVNFIEICSDDEAQAVLESLSKEAYAS